MSVEDTDVLRAARDDLEVSFAKQYLSFAKLRIEKRIIYRYPFRHATIALILRRYWIQSNNNVNNSYAIFDHLYCWCLNVQERIRKKRCLSFYTNIDRRRKGSCERLTKTSKPARHESTTMTYCRLGSPVVSLDIFECHDHIYTTALYT